LKEKRIVLFTGDGKGKTTAALGMALRAIGHGMNVHVFEFVKKNDRTGELKVLSEMPGVKIEQCGLGFIPEPSDSRFADHCQNAEVAFDRAVSVLNDPSVDIVILDEICVAVAKELLSVHRVCNEIRNVSEPKIIAMTGRSASQEIIDLADTVTEMRCIKHGYNKGIKAQEGVEF